MSLNDIRKVWIRHLANTCSISSAQCSQEAIQKICQVLSEAFSPPDDLDTTPSENNKSSGHAENNEANNHRAKANNTVSLESPSTNIQLLAQPQPASEFQAMDGRNLPKDVIEEENVRMVHCNTTKDSNVKMQNGDAGLWNTEMPGADEQPASSSGQANRVKIDKSSVAITEPTDKIEGISKDGSVVDSVVQPISTIGKPSHSVGLKVVPPPSYATRLKLAYTQVRALYLDLLYQDRFVLVNNPDFLLFLAEQPRVSHAFLSYLIHHPFGIRYANRDGSNADHGITPFVFPFLPVDLSLPTSLYFENRWALLNDPAWLWHVSMEEFLMASFWAEMSFRGGLGVMQRRREVTERPSKFAMAPF